MIAGLALRYGLDNGLARTPPMGYNTWYDVTGAFNESLLLETVDAHKRLDLDKYGYNYWNLDDLWSGGRYENGSIYADPQKFPSKTLRPLCDYVHSKGLLCGAYSDRGTKQCGPGPGSYNHTKLDANSFAEWQVDYLKEDSCAASQNHSIAYAEYGRMRDALNSTGRKIVFSLCGWNAWYSNPDPSLGYGGGKTLGNLWRIGPDDNNWAGILTNININSQLAKNAGPGGWNDPCLLLAETWTGSLRITQLQSRAQFSMWAIMASPLIISANIRNMSAMNVETYTNEEVIAVDQDVLGLQGQRLYGSNLQAPPKHRLKQPQQELEQAPQEGPKEKQQQPRRTSGGVVASALSSMSCTAGALGAGGDIHKANMSVAQASAWCTASADCAGYTAHVAVARGGSCKDAGSSGTVLEMFFKDASVGLNTDDSWTAWRKPGATTNVWGRVLSGGRFCLVFINVGADAADVTCDDACVMKLPELYKKSVTVRDIWKHEDVAEVDSFSSYTANGLAAEGGTAMFVLTPIK